jgi:hypothetical protein
MLHPLWRSRADPVDEVQAAFLDQRAVVVLGPDQDVPGVGISFSKVTVRKPE